MATESGTATLAGKRRLLALIGSPRKDGNTGILVRHLLDAVDRQSFAVEAIWLSDRRISPIRDCRPCLEKGRCLVDDDCDEVMEKFAQADCVVLATPLYWYGPSAQTKAFMDRWSCRLYMSTRLTGSQEAFRQRLRGKRIIAVSAHEEPGPYVLEHLWGMLQWSCNYLEMDLWAKLHGTGKRRGEVEGDAEALAQARRIGEEMTRCYADRG